MSKFLKVFGEGAPGGFTLYEDDGISYGYEQNAYNRIDIAVTCPERGLIQISMEQSNPDFCGFDGKRKFRFVIRGDGAEKTVFLNGTQLNGALENESAEVSVSFEKRRIVREAVS